MTDILSPEAAAIIALVFGLCFGSFLNVCIYRLPRELSIMGRSACPNCGKAVKAHYNVPVFGWLILRGRCSECRNPISPRYMFVEAIIGLLFFVSVWFFGLTPDALKHCVFGFLIVGLLFTDADLHLLPDTLTLPGFWLGLILSMFIPEGGTVWFSNHGADSMVSFFPYDFRLPALSLAAALLGAAVGAFFIWGIGEAYKRVRGIEGMGFGDVKLMAMVGAFLGVKLTVLTIGLGSILGSLAGLCAMLTVFFKRSKRYSGPGASARAWAAAQLMLRHYEMPFGVFLGAMALVSQWFGDRMLAWYFALYQ